MIAEFDRRTEDPDMPGFDKGKALAQAVELGFDEMPGIEILKMKDGFFQIKRAMFFSQGRKLY